MLERIEKFEEILEKDLKEELDKIINAGTISPDQVKTVKDAVKLMLKLKKYKEWEMGEDSNSFYDGYSTRRGRSSVTGRYVSRDAYPMRTRDGYSSDGGYSGMRSYGGQYQDRNYSGHNSRMLEELERMYETAQTEQERKMIDEWIRSAEMNR